MEPTRLIPSSENLKSIMSHTIQNVGLLSVQGARGGKIRACTISSFNTYSITQDGKGFALLCLSNKSQTGQYFKASKKGSFHYLSKSGQKLAEECTSAKEFELGSEGWDFSDGFLTFSKSKFTLDLLLEDVYTGHDTDIFLSQIVSISTNPQRQEILKYQHRNYL